MVLVAQVMMMMMIWRRFQIDSKTMEMTMTFMLVPYYFQKKEELPPNTLLINVPTEKNMYRNAVIAVAVVMMKVMWKILFHFQHNSAKNI